MELTAIYKGHTEAVEGVSKSGNSYRKMTAIFETISDHPKTIAFNAMNAACETVATLVEGRLYRVSFDVESREFNGKWYTDARAWAFRSPDEQPTQSAPQAKPQPQQVQSTMFAGNDLPF